VSRRATFWEEDDARAVAARLGEAGWSAEVVLERFAGDDDDEDHQWSVLTDAPSAVAGPLVEEHDGWLDDPGDEGPPVAPRPLDLPRAPRRVKGHFRDT
jgi:hypothetical protein